MKKCTKCGIEKELSEFHKSKCSKDGHKGSCKVCRCIETVQWAKCNPEKKRAAGRKWNKENPEKTNAAGAKYRKENPEKEKKRCAKYRKENSEKIKVASQKHYKENPERMKAKRKKYNKENPEYNKMYYNKHSITISAKQKIYYIKNYEKIAIRNKEYLQKNKEFYKEYSKVYMRKKRMDVNFRIIANLRNRVWSALKRGHKSASTMKLLGCTIPFLKKHLSKLFTKGMTFENYGTWHIDHIIPCASFDLAIPEQQRLCFNYRNLQPLWAKDNLEKSAKLPPNPQTSLPI